MGQDQPISPLEASKIAEDETVNAGHPIKAVPGVLSYPADSKHDDSSSASADSGAAEKAVIWVEFEPGEDPRRFGDHGDPFKWSACRKNTTTVLLVSFTFLTAFAGSAFPIAIPALMEKLPGTSPELASFGVGAYPLGFSVGPLIMSPISEETGRNPIYLISMFLSGILLLPIGLAPNLPAVLVCRFIAGFWGSAGSTMVGGSLADYYNSDVRGIAMAWFSFAAFSGGSLAEVVEGFVAQRAGFGWVWYSQVIANMVLFVAMCFTLKESRGSVLLTRRARKLRAETGDMRYRARAEDRPALPQLLRMAIARPLLYLVTEPVVMVFTIWVSFAWGLQWGILSSFRLVFSRVYGLDVELSGLAYLGLFVGTILAALANIYQERLYKRHFARKGPEARLYLSLVGGPLLSVGAWIFAFSQGRTTIFVPEIGLVFIMAGIFTVYSVTFSYLADSYLVYASSALAAQSFVRNVVGSVFPLFMNQCLEALTVQWAIFMFGCIGLALAVTPFVLFKYGKQIRARSPVMQRLQREHEERMAKAEEKQQKA